MFDSDSIHEECGVIGVYRLNDVPAAPYIYYGLYALQHRGQESAGIAVNNGGTINAIKNAGLVSEVFTSGMLQDIKGNIAIGHVMYSPAASSDLKNVQPITADFSEGSAAIASNGNFVNSDDLRLKLTSEGRVLFTESDVEIMLNLIAKNYKMGLVESIKEASKAIKGAYAMVLTASDKLVGLRDPYGMRPLCLGKTDNSYVLASETCALDSIGALFIRDILPGEIIVIDKNGIHADMINKLPEKRPCIFEYVYFARPDSTIDGISVYESRRVAGTLLAKKDNICADVVIGVPDSGIPAAIGYSQQSGIPYEIGLIKNKYIGRTFIQPLQTMREEAVMLKLNPLKDTIKGKRVVLVDDSIVRGTTSKRLVEILKLAGAKEVHLRISSPPTKHSCYFGVDTPNERDLIASHMNDEEICRLVGADSLMYMTADELLITVNNDKDFCMACFDGKYPMSVSTKIRNGKNNG